MMTIKDIYTSHKKIIKYILCSCITAGIETIIGYALKNVVGMDIVIANTWSIVIGMIVHYLLISKSVFESKYTLWSVMVYIITFVIGTILQNSLIWLCYDFLLENTWELFRFVISKGISVVLPFGIMYYLRNWLYSMK